MVATLKVVGASVHYLFRVPCAFLPISDAWHPSYDDSAGLRYAVTKQHAVRLQNALAFRRCEAVVGAADLLRCLDYLLIGRLFAQRVQGGRRVVPLGPPHTVSGTFLTRVRQTSSWNMGAVVGVGVLVAEPFIYKVGDEGQESDHSGRLAQRILSGRFRRSPTLTSEILPSAASLKPSLAQPRFEQSVVAESCRQTVIPPNPASPPWPARPS